jgi:hypothetical protein
MFAPQACWQASRFAFSPASTCEVDLRSNRFTQDAPDESQNPVHGGRFPDRVACVAVKGRGALLSHR